MFEIAMTPYTNTESSHHLHYRMKSKKKVALPLEDWSHSK
jgi:hypothetical protein